MPLKQGRLLLGQADDVAITIQLVHGQESIAREEEKEVKKGAVAPSHSTVQQLDRIK